MGMEFRGEFAVPAAPEAVIEAFADVRRMATLFPGAFIEGQEDDGAWRGGMLVAFGLRQIRFRGKATIDLDREARSGILTGRGTADMRFARIETRMHFVVTDSAPCGSVVRLSSETLMTGVLAEFARTGGPAVARAMMEQFAARLREDLAPSAAPAASPPAFSVLPSAAMRVEHLLWALVRRWFLQLVRRR